MFTVRIPYTPKPKASVRLGIRNPYNPCSKGMKATRTFVEKYIKENCPDFEPLKGAIFAIVHFVLPLPWKFTYNKRKNLHGAPVVKRPDADNLEKFLNDSLNGVAWTDDSQLAWVFRSKTYTMQREGETVITLFSIPESIAPDYEQFLAYLKEHIDPAM